MKIEIVFAESVELEEMIEIIGTLYEIIGVSKVGIVLTVKCIIDNVQDTATEHAKTVFSSLDIDGDGELTEDEFVKGCLEDLQLVDTLSK